MSSTTVSAPPSEASSAAASSGQTSGQSSGQLSHRQILQILGGLMLGMFLAALDQTIVTSAIRTIGDDLHGLSVQAWVTTAYLITATISTPLYGKLSDIYGRKRFFLAAITIFVIGSAACSFATSMYMLAGFRAFQGLGAGGLFSLALAIVGDIVPPRERAKYQGYFLAVFGTSSVLGPVIGGFFAGAHSILGLTGWRWVFLVNVPIGIIALVVVAKVLHLQHTPRKHRIDWWGAITICICLVPLLTVAEQGRTWGWGDGRSIACFAVGGAGLVLFIVAEKLMKEDALIPLRFFGNRTFSITAAGGFLVGMGMFGGLALLPLYLQIVRGATPTESGLQLLPLTAGLMLGSIVSGQLISRTGKYKIFPVLGGALMVGGLLLVHTVGVDTPYWRTGVFMAVFGFGLGLVMQPITLAVQNAMEPSEIGVATSSATFFRQMGATAGTAIFLSILFATVGDKIGTAFGADTGAKAALASPAVAADPANAPIVALARGAGVGSSALNDTSFLAKVAPVLARPFKTGFSDSMDMIFLLAAAILVLAFVLFLFLPQLALRTKSGMASRESAPTPEPVAASAASPASASAASPASPSSASPAAALDGVAASDGGAFLDGRMVPVDVDHRPATLADLDGAEPYHHADHVTAPLSNEAVVCGRIDGPDRRPLAGATLTITDFGGAQLARTVTSADGTYRMHLPTGGTYLLICAAEHHQPAASMITVAAGEIRRDLSLAGAGRLDGVVTDQNGHPIPDASIALTDARGEVVATTATGADGTYALTDLYPAEYTLTATAAGTHPAARTVSSGDRVDLVLVTNGTLTGVVSAAGRPLPEASVLAIDSYGAVAGARVTDPDGRYEFADLSPGVYTVTASGYAPVATRVELTGDRTDHDITLGSPGVPGDA